MRNFLMLVAMVGLSAWATAQEKPHVKEVKTSRANVVKKDLAHNAKSNTRPGEVKVVQTTAKPTHVKRVLK